MADDGLYQVTDKSIKQLIDLDVKKGEVLARVLNVDNLESNSATSEILAPCDLVAILHFPSASVLSGTQLYKCFTEYFEL